MSDIRQKVQDFYNQAGEYFSKTRQRSKEEDANWAEVRCYLAKLKDGDRVLDLGCGNGRLLTGVKAKIDYLGVDFSKTLLEEARKLHPREIFIQGDIAEEEVWDKVGRRKFEAIFCIATLHHLPTREQQLFVLRKIKERLKKGGFVYISVWNLWQKRYLKYHLDLKTKSQNWRWLYVPFMKKWRRFCFAFNRAYLAELMQEAGFKIERLFYADREGEESDFLRGRNLVGVGKI